MHRTLSTLALVVAGIAPAACGSTTATETETVVLTETTSVVEAEMREIVLPPDTAISVADMGDGGAEVRVRIPEPHPDAGTYRSTSPHLVQALMGAFDSLGKPGVETSIEVDDKGEIGYVTHSVTLQ